MPDRGAGIGLVLGIVGSLVGLGFIVIIAALVAVSGESTTPTTDDGNDGDSKPIVVQPGAGIPTERAVDRKEDDSRAEQTWRLNTCIDQPLTAGDIELRRDYSSWAINTGTAKVMRGKVAVVHLLLQYTALTWTMGKSRDVHRAALLSGRFFQMQAQRWGISDLEYVPIAWNLPTTFEPPALTLDSKHRVTNASSRELVKDALVASEASLGGSMRQVSGALNKEGYQQVAFLLHVPRTEAAARDFAYSAPSYSDIDVAIVFDVALDRLGYVVTHETMHLFGADDLYPLATFDANDRGDVMRASCRGYGGIAIQEMSAYAIGWRPSRPTRTYGWDPKRY